MRMGPGPTPVSDHGRSPSRRGGVMMNQDISLVAVRTDSIWGTVHPPPGFEVPIKMLHVTAGDAASVLETAGEPDAFWTDGTNTPSFKFRVPVPVAPLQFSINFSADSGGESFVSFTKTNLQPGTGPADVRLPRGLGLIAPAKAAAGVSAANEFQWSGPDSSVYVWSLWFAPANMSNTTFGGVVEVVTTQTVARIPRIPWFSVTLQPQGLYSWNVFALGPLRTIDEGAGPSRFAVRGDNFEVARGFQQFVAGP